MRWKVQGASVTIVDKPEKIGFNSTTEQNFPVYTGNVTYKTEIEVLECDNVKVKASSYRGGPTRCFTENDEYGYEYQFKPLGILKNPDITFEKGEK